MALAAFLAGGSLMTSPLFAQNRYRIEDVRIPSNAGTLAGSLYAPEQCTSCPAVVFLGGGSANTRANQIPFAERFASEGIIALIYQDLRR